MHTGEDGGEIFAAHGDRLDRLGVVNVFERTGAAGADVFQKGAWRSGHPRRRASRCNLRAGGGEHSPIRPTERRPRGKVLAPRSAGGRRPAVSPDLNAGRRAETEFRVPLAQRVHAHAVAHFGEEIVAGIRDRAADVERAVAAALPAVGVARGVAGGTSTCRSRRSFRVRFVVAPDSSAAMAVKGFGVEPGGVFSCVARIPRLQGVGGSSGRSRTERREGIGRILRAPARRLPTCTTATAAPRSMPRRILSWKTLPAGKFRFRLRSAET